MEIINRIKKLFRFDEPVIINEKEPEVIHTITREELIREAKRYVEAHRKDKK